MTPKDNEPERLRLHASQLIVGALAAVTAAALSARLGVAGTLAGTAAVSIISGVASAVYEHSAKRTRAAVETARSRIADQRQSTARTPRPDETAVISTPRRRWAYAGAGALATFLVAVGIITSIELIHGKPLSGSGSGTTITRAFEQHGRRSPTPDHPVPADSPSPSTTPATPTQHGTDRPAPSDSPSTTAQSPKSQKPQKSKKSPQPSDAPSPTPSRTSSDRPSPTPSDSPSATPSQTPSDQPSPSNEPSSPSNP
ncbi:MAG TPA: hypothetical protein VHC49_20755 [Mycobacteriales bacterium]|nr:hypothetical protein [Mycobacteriales bacterium]